MAAFCDLLPSGWIRRWPRRQCSNLVWTVVPSSIIHCKMQLLLPLYRRSADIAFSCPTSPFSKRLATWLLLRVWILPFSVFLEFLILRSQLFQFCLIEFLFTSMRTFLVLWFVELFYSLFLFNRLRSVSFTLHPRLVSQLFRFIEFGLCDLCRALYNANLMERESLDKTLKRKP